MFTRVALYMWCMFSQLSKWGNECAIWAAKMTKMYIQEGEMNSVESGSTLCNHFYKY